MTQPSPDVRPAAAVLQELNRGRSHRELSAELAGLVQSVRDTGKPGTVTLTLTVKPSKVDGGFEITDKITAKRPTFDRAASIFFADEDGNLTRNDPRQAEMFTDNELERVRDAKERAAGDA